MSDRKPGHLEHSTSVLAPERLEHSTSCGIVLDPEPLEHSVLSAGQVAPIVSAVRIEASRCCYSDATGQVIADYFRASLAAEEPVECRVHYRLLVGSGPMVVSAAAATAFRFAEKAPAAWPLSADRVAGLAE